MDHADPLVTIFSRFADPPVLLLALAALALSCFFGRFWCRYLCPAGAFLALAGGLRLLPRRWRPDVQPACCDYGVRRADDLDCLCCDRCRMPGARPVLEPGAPRLRPREIAWLLTVALGAAAFLSLLLMPAPSRTVGSTRGKPQAEVNTGRAISPQELARIRELIRQKKLSNREAKYYKAWPD